MKDFLLNDLTASRIIVKKQTNAGTSLIEEEIEQLKTQISKTHSSNDTTWNSSVLQVLFKNEAFARKYRIKIEKFLKDLLEEGEEFVVYHPPHNNGEQEYEDSHQTFHIDKVNESYTKDKSKQIVPYYSSTYEDTLDNGNIEATVKPEEEKPSMMTCFNCLGNHHMKQCPEKMNRNRINANKKEILLAGSTIRYHIEEEKNSVKPGILSTELRNALGLGKNQLPPFIYHMRVIGYPPGWMNEAVFEKSGLSMYDFDGKAISDGHSQPDKGTFYDGSKFIDFPGFNSPVPNGYIDEWQVLDMPPLQPHQQLKEALKSPSIIISSNMYKRKQFPSDEDIDMKKLKNVEVKSCNPQSNDVSENGSTSPQQSRLNFDFKTPDSKPSNKRHSMSISKSPGTPILEQGNAYQKLPDPIKFAQGITEHLPFENLPDAVGSYEKMRGVISCVQKKLNDIKRS